ncbi:MAG: metallophosphoesterase [Halobacteriales archaeon]|nr:metallophosphoesterase [Halobacteriales archaeon]
MLVLGDAHAVDPPKRAALEAAYAAADEDVAVQAGDLMHYDLPAPTWFIAGNNEDLDVIEALRRGETPAGVHNAHLLASTVVGIEGLRVAGLSGNHAPTQFEKDRDELAPERRRHFVREDVERLLEMVDIDVLLVHESPHGLDWDEEYDVGCTHVDRILREVEPRLCLVGHHHQSLEGSFGPTRVVGLEPVWEAHYTLDPGTLELTRYPA